MSLAVYGVRHHGPGSARSLRAALEADPPDVLLVEGPPDAAPLLAHLGDDALVPPVAMLVYPADQPGTGGVFYPFAAFSPEWVAMRWAAARGIPVRFCDLPIAHRASPDQADGDEVVAEAPRERVDPIGALATAAGWPDPERYWEHLVEQRSDAGVFEAITLAMTTIREQVGALIPDDPHEARREAWMRRVIRAARKEHGAVAVVCGAWHVPALLAAVPAKDDDARLRDLPKAKVEACWVPWSLGRLGRWSGYGAGVEAPGWYQHLWEHPEDPAVTWLVETARALREQGFDASSASVTEAVRLAGALAALRGEHAPGLDALDDAALAALCGGDPVRLQLVATQLARADRLGRLPEGVPQPPLLRDLYAQAKRLRMKVEAASSVLELDLRKEHDRARSALLRRVGLLGVGWGTEEAGANRRGTFRERWTLCWEPSFAVGLVEASPLGATVDEAASAKVLASAEELRDLAALARLLDRALTAGLDGVVPALLDTMEALAVRVADPSPLLEPVPALVDVLRYGDVRGTAALRVAPVLSGLLERALIALIPGSQSLDDDAADALAATLRATQAALVIHDDPALLDPWDSALAALLACDRNGSLLGAATRLRLDRGTLDDDALATAVSYALSAAHGPAYGARWLQGLLAGGATMLLHRDAVWGALDGWLAALAEDAFVEVLPGLRRAFADFPAPERARMAERLARGRRAAAPVGDAFVMVDRSRADRVLPVLAALLGGVAVD
jgi:hypothetical protein